MAAARPRRIVLTGCTRGCGAALLAWFDSRGHTVHGCGRSPGSVQDCRERYRGKPHTFEVVDVACDASVAAWAGRILQDGGPPDLLLNNAALIAPVLPLWKVSPEDFDAVVDANIKGSANVLRHFLPAMIAAGSGVAVNFSSGWGRSVSPGVAAYCASKWAVEGLTRALAAELPPGLAAVALNPGIICTDMLRRCFGGDAEAYPEPSSWAEAAGPFLLALGPGDNGSAATVPGVPVD